MIILEKDKIKEKFFEEKNLKNKKTPLKNKIIYAGIFFLSALALSSSKMHEIRWMPNATAMSEYYKENGSLLSNEKSKYVQYKNEMLLFLQKIDAEGKITNQKDKNNQPILLTMDMLNQIYGQEFFLYMKNTSLSPEMIKLYPDNDYVKYKLIQEINKKLNYTPVENFQNYINSQVKNEEKNMSNSQIQRINNYIKIRNEVAIQINKDNIFLSPGKYRFSSLLYNITHKKQDDNNNDIVNDFGLINSRILSNILIPKIINSLTEEERKNIGKIDFAPMSKEEMVKIKGK